MDAKDGYYQVELDFKSRLLTTFTTPFGRYSYKRLPFGLKSANEVFHKYMTQMFENIEGVIVLFDDLLIYGKTLDAHNTALINVLNRAREVNVQLNSKKCKYGKSEVNYMGHVIGVDGVKPDSSKVNDLLKLETPSDKKGIERLLGVVNYLTKFIPNASSLTETLRKLLVKDVEFCWEFEQQHALDKILKVLTSEPVLKYYDPNSPVKLILNTDSSSKGLGACIMQDKPIAYASRSLTSSELNYAQIEKELLGIVFGCERFSEYLIGNQVTVETDHKPLVNIFNKPLTKAPNRILRMMLRLHKFDLNVTYKPGSQMFISDTLSRAVPKVNVLNIEKNELYVQQGDADFKSKFNISIEMWDKFKRDRIVACF